MLHLDQEHLENRVRIDRWPTAPGSVAVSKGADQELPEAFDLHRGRQNLERIIVLAQPVQVQAKTGCVGASKLSL